MSVLINAALSAAAQRFKPHTFGKPHDEPNQNGRFPGDKCGYRNYVGASLALLRPVPVSVNPQGRELWKPIAGFEGLYEVSSFGNVKSLRTSGRGVGTRKGPYLSPGISSKYYKVVLHVNGESHGRLVHRMVAEAFLGPCPDGYEVNHKNLDKLDNHVWNLEYMTHRDNLRHAFGILNRVDKPRKPRISRAAIARFKSPSPDNVLKILKLLSDGELTDAQIAERFGLSEQGIYCIKTSKVWANVGRR